MATAAVYDCPSMQNPRSTRRSVARAIRIVDMQCKGKKPLYSGLILQVSSIFAVDLVGIFALVLFEQKLNPLFGDV